MNKQKHNISIDAEVVNWLDEERAVPNLPLSTMINMKLRKMMLAESGDADDARAEVRPPVASREPTRYKIGPKNRLGTKRSAPPVLKVQPGMDITIR